MTRVWQVRLRWLTLLICLMGSRVTFAGWEFTHPGDPNRNWSVRINSGGTYDDNFNSSETDIQSGFQYYSDVALRASIPFEQCLVGANYDYQVSYPRDIDLGGFNETHNFSLTANYAMSPRLTLALNETFISTYQPELVQTQAGVPVTVVQSGNYIYNNVAGNLNYALSPRWNLAVSGNWDIWRYQEASAAEANDHEDYQTTLSALYGVDQRTTAGLNYQYGQNLYTNPGTNNALNAHSHTFYLSVVRIFNPRMSVQLNGGYTMRESDDGSVSTSPSMLASFVYNYGLSRSISMTVSHVLSAANAGVTREFSASENTAVSLRINHRVTGRLNAVGDIAYVFSSFTSPVQAGTLSADEQDLSGHAGLTYAFRDWVALTLDYQHTRLLTSNLPGVPKFSRNQVSLGLSFSY